MGMIAASVPVRDWDDYVALEERTDQGEKLLRYQAIPSLREYLVARSTRAEAHIFRAADGWRKQAIDLDGEC